VKRSKLVVGLLTFSSVVLWAGIGNLIRLSTIAITLHYLGIDLSSGAKHTILGFLVFLLVSTGLALTHYFVNALCQPVRNYSDGLVNSNAWNKIFDGIVNWPSNVDRRKIRSQTNTVPEGATVVRLRFSKLWFALSAVLLLWSVPSAVTVLRSLTSITKSRLTVSEAAKFPGEESMPNDLGIWHRAAFRQEVRSTKSSFGEFSNVWEYRKPDSGFVVSLDFPFRGWHPLWDCYEMTGWKRLSSNIVRTESGDKSVAWPYAEVVLENDIGTYAYLWFSFFDENGQPFIFQEEETVSKSPDLLSRFTWNLNSFVRAKGEAVEPITYQVQMFCESGQNLSEPDRKQMRDLFLSLRHEMLQNCEPIVIHL
jgi:hypothetical protein